MWLTRKSPHSRYFAVKLFEAEHDLPYVEDDRVVRFSERWRSWFSTVISAVVGFLILTSLGLLVHSKINQKAKTTSSSPCLEPRRRQEWRQLSDDEKAEYISAIKCLHELPSMVTGEGHLSDDFPWVHKHTGEITHYAAPFLPWHRYFLHIYEQSLRNSCGYQGSLPYWDWTLDWEEPAKSPIWDPQTGFGGDGTSGGDESIRWGTCVAEGPLVGYEVYWNNKTAKPHCLSRGFGRQDYPARFAGEDFSPSAIESAFEKRMFIDFSMALEVGPHNALPNNICGDFMLFEAPNDPVFLLHHAQVDRLWWMWQRDTPQGAMAYNGPKEGESKEPSSLDDILPMLGLGPDLAVRHVMSTESELLCYTY